MDSFNAETTCQWPHKFGPTPQLPIDANRADPECSETAETVTAWHGEYQAFCSTHARRFIGRAGSVVVRHLTS